MAIFLFLDLNEILKFFFFLIPIVLLFFTSTVIYFVASFGFAAASDVPAGTIAVNTIAAAIPTAVNLLVIFFMEIPPIKYFRVML